MSKKLLITGGAGFIGLHLANRLLDVGHQVHLIDDLSRAVFDSELKETLNRKKIEFSNINLLNNNLKLLDRDFDIVFHLAALIGIPYSYKSPLARALIGSSEGDEVEVPAPGGIQRWEIVEVQYLG